MNTVLTLSNYKLKILLRDTYTQKIKLKAWISLLLGYIVFFVISIIFHQYLVLVSIFTSLVIYVISNYTLENKSWINSLVIFHINRNLIKSMWVNFLSTFFIQIGIVMPFLLSLNLKEIQSMQLLLFVSNICFTIGLGFMFTELAYYENQFKKGLLGLLSLQIGLFAFFTSGAINYSNFTLNEKYVFLQYLYSNSLEGLLVLNLFTLLLLLVGLYLYFTKYYHRIAESHD